MAIQQEVELYEPVKQWLETLGYAVKSEVKSCDVVARRPDASDDEPLLVVELKKSFNLPLLWQALERLTLTPIVYVCVESVEALRGGAKKQQAMVRLCERMGIGLITVRFRANGSHVVQALVDPAVDGPKHEVRKPTPRMVRKQRALLKEFQSRTGDYNAGGVTRRKIMTAYREQALVYAHWLAQHDALSTRELRAMPGVVAVKVQPILHGNVYGWFEPVSRGVYAITARGREALAEHAEMVCELVKESV